MCKYRLHFYLIILFGPSLTIAQDINTPDSYESYLYEFERLDSLDNELQLHYTIKKHAKKPFSLVDPIIKANYNSGYAQGFNDGAIWKGKGFNSELHFGISGSLGLVSYTIQPTIFYAQNTDFELANTNRNVNNLNYAFSSGIDWVQRYGEGSYSQIHLGQSELKLSKFGMQVAFGTQNYMVGPSVHFPIMLSNNAGGMPKLNIGTDGPQTIEIGQFKPGKIEFNVIYGWMKESDYFDSDNANNKRFLNALFLGYQPSFAPNLTLGINRVMYKQTRYGDNLDWLGVFYNPEEPQRIVNGDTVTSQNDFFDQMASATMEWKFSDHGFRVYTEFALNDFNGSALKMLLTPEHSRAYTLGLQKLFDAEKIQVLVNYEHTNLSRNHTYLWRAEPTYYTHGFNRQGYTNNGQIMGASIGPGANADHIELRFKQKETGSILVLHCRRTEFNKDYLVTNNPSDGRKNVELNTGFGYFQKHKTFTYGFESTLSIEHNRYYVAKDHWYNFYFALSLKASLD